MTEADKGAPKTAFEHTVCFFDVQVCWYTDDLHFIETGPRVTL